MIPSLFDRRLWRQRKQHCAPGFLTQNTLDQLAERITHFQRQFQTGLVIGPHLPTPPALQTYTIPQDIVCDEEFFPFAPQSLDVIVSILGLQTINDLPGTLKQFATALKPDGLFMAALFGGETLMELRQAFYEAEMKLYQHFSSRVMPMLNIQDVGMLIQRAGFALPVIDVEKLSLPFSHIIDLMHCLQAEGFTNVLYERNKTLLSRALLAELSQRYIGSTATFEIIFMTAWAPAHVQQKPLKPGTAIAKLETVLK